MIRCGTVKGVALSDVQLETGIENAREGRIAPPSENKVTRPIVLDLKRGALVYSINSVDQGGRAISGRHSEQEKDDFG